MLYYCKRCGRFVYYFDANKAVCDYCKNHVYPVPEQFLRSKCALHENLKEQFINEYIKSSSEFNQDIFDAREEYAVEHADDFQKHMAALAHGEAILKEKENKHKIPVIECPYCHSTNTTKISIGDRYIGTVNFAAFSKQWHCNSCGSDF